MKHDFETCIDRRDTGSLKWNKYKGRDVLPMWVADMDFVSAPEIVNALQVRAAHGVFGYTVPYEEVITEVIAYVERRHGWRIDPSWLVWLPGLVQGLNLVCRAFGKPGDAVMVNTPVYPPFLSAPHFSDRRRITVPLVKVDGAWRMDFEAMERAVTPDTRVFILCNPHNPVGAVFSRADLARLVDFCERHNIVLCSDEIHCDLILDDVPHVCTATLGPVAASRTVTFLSPQQDVQSARPGLRLRRYPESRNPRRLPTRRPRHHHRGQRLRLRRLRGRLPARRTVASGPAGGPAREPRPALRVARKERPPRFR
jgi:cystathionine beta-lyase